MKKKKHHHHHHQQAHSTFNSRRRRRFRTLLPLLSLTAGALLFLFALLSFPSPPIPHHHQHHHLNVLNHTSSINGIEVMKLEKENEIGVPRDGGSIGRELWSTNRSRLFYGCSNPSKNFLPAIYKTHPNHYLLIATSGGLNQQRTGITDAVVAAYILNATLVVPTLDQKSYWKDASNFSDIFDVDWFISYLAKDVKLIKQLPTVGGKAITPYSTRVPRKCNTNCYHTRILPLLDKKHAVQLTKFDYRLSNRLATDLQKLRCRANYHALKFTGSISEMGRKLIDRMRMKSKHFIAVHLRFEPDMLAFSGCYYGGGKKERKELGAIRKRWKTLHSSNPERGRRQGRCPLTPREVGLMLRALGFGADVHIYVASGEVYGGEESLAPLKALFPNFHTKETIASQDELAPFSSFSSRLAALDYIVCDESDVFVSNNNGNMAKMLAGRRRYFGHKPTVRPNAKKLYKVFMNQQNMTWEEFALHIRTHQVGFMGEPKEIKPGRGVFHENPAACICERYEKKGEGQIISQSNVIRGQKLGIEHTTEGDGGEVSDEQVSSDDEPDLTDVEYVENENAIESGDIAVKTDTEYGEFLKSELPELEDVFFWD